LNITILYLCLLGFVIHLDSFFKWGFLLNLVHIGNLQFLTIFYNLAATEHGFLPKQVKYE